MRQGLPPGVPESDGVNPRLAISTYSACFLSLIGALSWRALAWGLADVKLWGNMGTPSAAHARSQRFVSPESILAALDQLIRDALFSAMPLPLG